MLKYLVPGAVAVATALIAMPARAQDSSDDLAKQLSNPIANLISVPFQFNAAFGAGPDDDGESYTLNIQPVIPLSIAPDWNLIVRTILPVVGQEDVFPTDDSVWGLGNTLQSFFFSPKQPTAGGLVWGVGPAFYYPTATDPLLGPNKWGAGPTGVALVQKGHWTVGVLANQIWSFGGSEDPGDVNALFVQPFASYALGRGRTISSNIQASYDWIGHQWTVPWYLTYSKIVHLGRQPVSLQFGGIYYLEKPPGGPDWGLQAQITFLFPKGKK
jgi:hypothetical protein